MKYFHLYLIQRLSQCHAAVKLADYGGLALRRYPASFKWLPSEKRPPTSRRSITKGLSPEHEEVSPFVVSCDYFIELTLALFRGRAGGSRHNHGHSHGHRSSG